MSSPRMTENWKWAVKFALFFLIFIKLKLNTKWDKSHPCSKSLIDSKITKKSFNVLKLFQTIMLCWIVIGPINAIKKNIFYIHIINTRLHLILLEYNTQTCIWGTDSRKQNRVNMGSVCFFVVVFFPVWCLGGLSVNTVFFLVTSHTFVYFFPLDSTAHSWYHMEIIHKGIQPLDRITAAMV